MAGLPSVQKAKKERMQVEFKPVTQTNSAEPEKNVPADSVQEATIDENLFAVEPIISEAPAVSETKVVSLDTSRETTSQPIETDDNWKTQAKEFEHKWKSVSGKYERLKYDYQNLEDQLKELKNSVEELKNSPSTKILVPDPEEELTPEEQEAYKSAGPFVNKLINKRLKEAKESLVEPLRKEIAELKTNSAKFSENLTKTTDDLFYSHVKSRVPDLDEVCNKDNQDWQNFAQNKIPFTGITIFDALKQAHDSRDLSTVVEIIDSFKSKYKQKPNDGLSALISPNLGSSGNTSAILKQKPVLKWSERKKASEDFRKGRINKNRLDQIDAIYKQAEQENRINYEA